MNCAISRPASNRLKVTTNLSTVLSRFVSILDPVLSIYSLVIRGLLYLNTYGRLFVYHLNTFCASIEMWYQVAVRVSIQDSFRLEKCFQKQSDVLVTKSEKTTQATIRQRLMCTIGTGKQTVLLGAIRFWLVGIDCEQWVKAETRYRLLLNFFFQLNDHNLYWWISELLHAGSSYSNDKTQGDVLWITSQGVKLTIHNDTPRTKLLVRAPYWRRVAS